MALQSMFQMLNRGVNRHPLAQPGEHPLVSRLSQSVGGLGGYLTGLGQHPQDPYSFMTDPARVRQGMLDMEGLDLTTTQGMSDAAKLYTKMRMPERAEAMSQKAQARKDVLMQRLDEGQKEIRQASIDTKLHRAAMKRARERGDTPELAMMQAGALTPTEYMKSQTGIGRDLQVGTTSRTIQDSKGNYYTAVPITDKKTGKVRTEYSPLTPGAPATPVGKITPVSGTSGVSAYGQKVLDVQEAGEKGDIETADIKERKWNDKRSEIIGGLPEVYELQASTSAAIDIMENGQRTGGVPAMIAGFKDFFGLGDTASEAELNQVMGQYILANIKKLGANPSTADLNFLLEASANIRKGNKANITLFKAALEKLDRVAQAGQYLVDNPNATEEEYLDNYAKIVGVDGKPPTVKLSDLD